MRIGADILFYAEGTRTGPGYDFSCYKGLQNPIKCFVGPTLADAQTRVKQAKFQSCPQALKLWQTRYFLGGCASANQYGKTLCASGSVAISGVLYSVRNISTVVRTFSASAIVASSVLNRPNEMRTVPRTHSGSRFRAVKTWLGSKLLDEQAAPALIA